MCFFVCVFCLKPNVQETEIFKEFILWNMSGTPVGKIVSRNIANTASFVLTDGLDSELVFHGIINKEGRRVKPFIENLRFATEHSKSVSLMLFWSVRGVGTKKVKCESQCKITVDSFLNIFPDIKENVLYIIHKDYSKLYQ